MKPEILKNEFEAMCHEYEGIINPYGTEFEVQKKIAVFRIIYSFMKVELVYRIKGNTLIPASTLYCRVYPYKNRPICITMPEVFPYTGIKEFRACVFPYIENADRLRSCFTALTEIIDEHLSELEAAFSDPANTAVMNFLASEAGVEEPDKLLSGDEAAEWSYMFSRNLLEITEIAKYAACDGYYFYLEGNIERSLKYYRREVKKNRLSAYEESLLEFIEASGREEFVPITEECFSHKAARPYISTGKTAILNLLKSALLIYGISAVICCLIVGVIGAVLAKDTVCYFSAPWYVGLIPGIFPAIFGSMALFRRLAPIVDKRNYSKQLEFDDVTDSAGAYKFAGVVFGISVAAALVLSVSMSVMPIRMYDTYGDFPDPHSPGRMVFQYEDIDCIYYITARHNIYGDRIERSSYVIRMKDGTVIDFDGTASVKETEKEAVPLFEKLGIKVVRVDSDHDIPV